MEPTEQPPNNWSLLEHLPWGTVGGEPVSLRHALRLMKLEFDDSPAPRSAWSSRVVERIILNQTAREMGLTPPAEEVRALMGQFRRERGLLSARHTEQSLGFLGCTVADFTEAMELQWLERELKRLYAVVPAEAHFRQNLASYDAAVLSELTVEDEGVAQELALQIREEGADFAALARRYSVAPSRSQAGFLGAVRRESLTGVESAAVFAAPPDTVVGPFMRGRQHRLLRVHELRRAEFTDAIRTEIEERLWEDWLQERTSQAQPHIDLLQHL